MKKIHPNSRLESGGHRTEESNYKKRNIDKDT